MFLLRDADISFRTSVLLLIMAGNQSETRTVTFCCKKRYCTVQNRIFDRFGETVATARHDNF